jgi:hypothetical protein
MLAHGLNNATLTGEGLEDDEHGVLTIPMQVGTANCTSCTKALELLRSGIYFHHLILWRIHLFARQKYRSSRASKQI